VELAASPSVLFLDEPTSGKSCFQFISISSFFH
jgi:ABC-type transporter Mla maintaining outer membrane lipid asymmetry ATPase subunit MlaF